MNTKKTFAFIFALFAIMLMLLPFMVSFNEVLTKLVEATPVYQWIQTYIVPVEAKILGVLLMILGYQYSVVTNSSSIIVNSTIMKITWNCLGWQSLILFLVTLFVGFQGKYTKISVLEAIIIGILSIFWLNILRMFFIIILAVHAPSIFRVVFHDYLAAIMTIIWLFFFWWFAYKYILEEKMPIVENQASNNP